MLGVVFLLLPGAFGFAIWRSYHQVEGDAYNPGDGKRRWRDEERS